MDEYQEGAKDYLVKLYHIIDGRLQECVQKYDYYSGKINYYIEGVFVGNREWAGKVSPERYGMIFCKDAD